MVKSSSNQINRHPPSKSWRLLNKKKTKYDEAVVIRFFNSELSYYIFISKLYIFYKKINNFFLYIIFSIL